MHEKLQQLTRNFKNEILYGHKNSVLNAGLNLHNLAFLGGRGVSVGGLKELGRHTLGSNNATLDVSSLANKRYLQFLIHALPNATSSIEYNINNDTSALYARRISNDFGADATANTLTTISENFSNNAPKMVVGHISNYASKTKLLQTWHSEALANSLGVGSRLNQTSGKYYELTTAINRLTATCNGSTFASGSELIVLGIDPADTHTNNFWTDSGASTTLGGTSSNVQLSVGAHKWYMIYAYIKPTASLQPYLRFSNDSSSVYNYTYSEDGASSAGSDNDTKIKIGRSVATNQFIVLFIDNYTSAKKHVVAFCADANSAGVANVPHRWITNGACTLTTQATEIDFVPSTSTFASGSKFAVWYGD